MNVRINILGRIACLAAIICGQITWVAPVQAADVDTALQPAVPPAGSLQTVGGYPIELHGQTVTALPDGSLFVYGADPRSYGIDAQGGRMESLRNRNLTSTVGSYFAGLMWNPKRQGWKKTPQTPDCHYNLYLFSATAMNDGRVLLAGGLCHEPKFSDDPNPAPPYLNLSIWNGATQHWDPGPQLQQGRIFHTATALADGGVMIAGGESDPMRAGAAEPVLASVEIFRNGKVLPLESLQTARARHAATRLNDGSVMITGGYGPDGTAISSVEIWDPASEKWRSAPPLKTARFNHSATLLDNGRVLVAGGIGGKGMTLDSVEIWNPVTSEWTAGAPLPGPLQVVGALLLTNGNVLVAAGSQALRWPLPPWAVLWDKSTEKWQPAFSSSPVDNAGMTYQPALVPHPDGSVHIFTADHILLWRPTDAFGDSRKAPQFESAPAVAALADGRAMFVGRMLPGLTLEAYLWDPKNNSWQKSGALASAYATKGPLEAVQLPSGVVLLVGYGEQHDLKCEMWQGGETWTTCGTLSLPLGATPDFWDGLGLSGEGRAVFIAGLDQIFVFDEHARTWALSKSAWDFTPPRFGTLIRPDKPLAQIYDEETKQSREINALAARNLDRMPAQNVPPVMLWDPKKQFWTYILEPYKMGRSARFLPDGCAMSWQPFSLFNPVSGEVTMLPRYATGIRGSEAQSAILGDGTFVIGGTSESATAPSWVFFHRKAGCAGFVIDAAEGLMPPVFYKDDIAPAAPNPATTLPPRTWQDTMLASLGEYRWLLLAIVASIALYFALIRVLPAKSQPSGASLSKPEEASAGASSGARHLLGNVLIAISVLAQIAEYAIVRIEWDEARFGPLETAKTELFWAAIPGAVAAYFFAKAARDKHRKEGGHVAQMLIYYALAVMPLFFYFLAWRSPLIFDR